MHLVVRRNTIAVVGIEIDYIAEKWIKHAKDNKIEIDNKLFENRKKRDSENYHITVVNKNERNSLNEYDLNKSFRIYDVGIGKIKNCYYVIIYSPDLQKFRENLPLAYFHISLAFETDIHDQKKDFNTLITKPYFKNIMKYENPGPIMFERMINNDILPRNFSKVTEKLYASSIPTKDTHFNTFKEIGITDIISLLETDAEFEPIRILKDNIGHHTFLVKDRTSMTSEELFKIIDIINKSDKTLVHCIGGIGRTATAIYGYLLSKGFEDHKIKEILNTRKTIFTENQKEFLKIFKKSIHLSISFVPSEFQDIKIIMMVGFPFSGKSTLCTKMEEKGLVIYSQDTLGRSGYINSLKLNNFKNPIVLDRCHLTIEQRKESLEYTGIKPSECIVIFMNTSYDECKYRINRRKDHPVIKDGSGLRILEELKNKLEIPTYKESFKKIIVLSKESEIDSFCNEYSLDSVNIESHIFKFPRTTHLVNFGAATRDDLIISEKDSVEFLNCELFIEEKIDGANLGLSIIDNKIVAQNRSHYVNSEYSSQFKTLDQWIFKNSNDLWTILGTDMILFGEWMYAQHSILYNRLPDYFLAFDLYSKKYNKFLSRHKMEEILKDTNISIIKILHKKSFKNLKEISDLINEPSNYYDGPIEGIYIRKCSTEFLEHRAKIVRPDFSSSIQEHWSSKILKINSIDYS